MEAIFSALCWFIPGFRKRHNHEHVKKTRMERRREKMSQINRLLSTKNYSFRERQIKNQITFNYFRVVVVWSQVGENAREEILKKAQSFGKILRIQDRWLASENGGKKWFGVLIEFARECDAKTASLGFPLLIKFVRATMLETVISTLAICELLRPDNRKESTKVVIRRKIPFRADEVDDLYKSMSKYGRVQTFYVNNRKTTIGTYCEVTYTYVTQAYLAMIMTHGKEHNIGVLIASIDKRLKDAEILKDAKDFIVLMYQSFFPN